MLVPCRKMFSFIISMFSLCTSVTNADNIINDELGSATVRSPKNVLFVDTQIKYIESYPHINNTLLGPEFWSKMNSHNRTVTRRWNDFKSEIIIRTSNYEK
ncbi:hypothetical protein BDA99DRAFT_544055 [Phascolomyces articulosus]|uniref:Uncharacterized protein n=1 Tax=Phascolomyces articulosus TaxID=60185 RepID=A0AAD5JL24_9FUNG|nr:hypothetical protein BDA99DRAFT_544055 [Phascolomyces articulosus]